MEILFILIVIALIVFAIKIFLKAVKSPYKTSYGSYKRNVSKAKGRFGERKVARILGNNIENKQYVFHDMLFKTQNGKTCQIDHILINKHGIFVIETKNYSGMIFGSENEREWTQVLGYGNEKHKHYNPIKQNESHIYHLSRYLKADNIYNNIVVFLDGADISHVSASNVYKLKELPHVINYGLGINLSTIQINYYYKKLLELQENSNVSLKEHIKNIHDEQYNIEHNICPRCGCKLVIKNSNYGKFYGCSNYPKCKFKKNL